MMCPQYVYILRLSWKMCAPKGAIQPHISCIIGFMELPLHDMLLM